MLLATLVFNLFLICGKGHESPSITITTWTRWAAPQCVRRRSWTRGDRRATATRTAVTTVPRRTMRTVTATSMTRECRRSRRWTMGAVATARRGLCPRCSPGWAAISRCLASIPGGALFHAYTFIWLGYLVRVWVWIVSESVGNFGKADLKWKTNLFNFEV